MAIDIKQLRPDNIFDILKDNVSVEIENGKSYYKCQISEGETTIKKIGYICPLMYIDYPFYLKFNNENEAKKAFYVGKTGIYEIQFETIEDKEMNFDIVEVWLPVDVDFIFDYEIIK